MEGKEVSVTGKRNAGPIYCDGKLAKCSKSSYMKFDLVTAIPRCTTTYLGPTLQPQIFGQGS